MNQDEYKKHLAKGSILVAMCEWHTSKNPMAVWAAVKDATAAGLEIPEWARDYLYEASTRLLDGADAEDALGIRVKGGPGKLKQWTDARSRDRAIGMCVTQEETGKHESLTQVFEYVGTQLDIDPELIAKWWYQSGKVAWDENPVLP